MPKIKLVAVVFLLLVITSNATKAQWLPDSNAMWSVWQEKYFLNGDSVLNGTTYQKVAWTDTVNSVDQGVLQPLASHWALIRQEANGKVYTLTPSDTAEVLLYDFNAQVGDTLELQPFLAPFAGGFRVQASVVVEAIDSILVATTWRKRLKLNTVGLSGNSFSADEYWIEGIGSTAGLFGSGSFGFVASDFDYPTLLCFNQNDSLVYSSPLHTACFQSRTVSLAEHNFTLSVYPNPAKDFLQIESATASTLKIRVFNLNGTFIQSFSLAAGEQKMDLPANGQGLYILEINAHNEKTSPVFKRLIIE